MEAVAPRLTKLLRLLDFDQRQGSFLNFDDTSCWTRDHERQSAEGAIVSI